MDKTILHLGTHPRHFKALPPVATLGWLPGKDNITTRRFRSVNFSIVMEGRGSYQAGQAPREMVHAPCLLLQVPGVNYRFGPDGVWKELYMMFDEIHLAALAGSGFIPEGNGVFALDPGARWANEAGKLLQLLTTPPNADRLDMICATLLMEMFLSPATTVKKTETTRAQLLAMRAAMEATPQKDHDTEEWSRQMRVSPVHLRRLWQRNFKVSPGQFLAQERVRAACRLLVETEKSIKEIAFAVGYQDPQYFSRRFHALTGSSPKVYRERYRFEQE